MFYRHFFAVMSAHHGDGECDRGRLRPDLDMARWKKLIAAALIVCATIAVVAGAIVRHVNNTKDALWCHDTRTTPPRTASASEQAENSSKLERSHPLGLSGAAPRPQIRSQCWKLGWIEGHVRRGQLIR